MSRILTLTANPTIDLSWEVDHLDPEGKLRAQVRSVVGGGGGINVARGVARLGGAATAVHTAGKDTGNRLNRLLDGEGLEHLPIDIGGETREAIVLFETDDDRSFHVVPGGPSLTEDEARRCLDALIGATTDGTVVVLSGSLPGGVPDDFYAEAARRIKERGGSVVLDTSGPGLQETLDEGVHLLKPNKREAGDLVGRPIEDFRDALAANEHLLERGAAQIVATTLGDKGALCSTPDGHTEVHTPALLGPPVSDAGAGDSFVAGFTYRLVEGDDPVEACTMAVAAAAASVLTPGTELFDRAQAESLRGDVETRACETGS